MSIAQFQEFFDHCVGEWTTERTYHYLSHQEVERSHTEFVIHPLDNDAKAKVLEDNQRLSTNLELETLPGYRLAFQTVSEKGDEVSQALNILFVPQKLDFPIIEGDYLRDKAYEEAKPMVAHFRYDTETRELLMKTTYTRVVSVDSITLINPELRIRRIINYQRPLNHEPLNTVLLVGFGVEQKQS
ncbi:Chromophore lyase CpcS/CpeS 1 [Planktothrix tepida]|uniref:Chromophore lyase CpcS/CpeS n=2 Tax=Planktothrix TaxID=54304 RepID=A0A1J1LRT0_9CYAN|nr:MULTISPECIES: phycobiliprotein lyase [Planktothrix]CAD5940677.1 Chromophore lyase CpcS/CpeS 1 [Planktothrix pseudagardhii]CAD5970248.1 Chromophore lyase CpcS/CpeS 1 [Planktothrix tepida]CUR35312.1 Chromophore lyase CpcS/CpeS 1 [Planktothrix tepida PCC 9214]